jgi:hypothetical protein
MIALTRPLKTPFCSAFEKKMAPITHGSLSIHLCLANRFESVIDRKWHGGKYRAIDRRTNRIVNVPQAMRTFALMPVSSGVNSPVAG